MRRGAAQESSRVGGRLEVRSSPAGTVVGGVLPLSEEDAAA